MRDEFLSEEDLALSDMTWPEVVTYWSRWLREAQATNDADRWIISHGVFEEVPEAARDTREGHTVSDQSLSTE